MKIAPKTVVTLTYELFVGDDAADEEFEMIEMVTEEEPMAFIHSLSGLPEKFEENLLGLSTGDSFDFVLSSEEGYGEFDNEAVAELPLSMFQIEPSETENGVPEGMLEEGNIIPFTDQDGHQLTGRVIGVEGENVIMDFNHPLAGRFLHFKGVVLGVREATPIELDHGHVHGLGGVNHEEEEA